MPFPNLRNTLLRPLFATTTQLLFALRLCSTADSRDEDVSDTISSRIPRVFISESGTVGNINCLSIRELMRSVASKLFDAMIAQYDIRQLKHVK